MKQWKIIDEEFISYTGGTAQLISNGECKIHLWERPKDAQLFCDKLNAINEENEQLKHRLAISNKARYVTTLEKENELLKKELDYIQNSITEHIKHQKTELGQKALKEIIADYNEWMLGHKELEE